MDTFKFKYDKNSTLLAGKLVDARNDVLMVEVEKNVFPVLVPMDFSIVKEKVVSSLNQKASLYALVYGMLSNGEKEDYIYATSISFSSYPQKDKRFATISGTLVGVYDNGNRKRLLIETTRKKSTRIFVTLFNSRGIHVDKSMIGKKLMIDGILENYKNKFSIIADYVFVELAGAEGKTVNSNSDEENLVYNDEAKELGDEFLI
ncbi:hypothetical protein YS40_007 [Thermus phage phiYS40]|uniref:hypothetical protein n=1 Tax=Thermus phage phiYS40 TaxID=407392 RepID=UPI0000E6897D|nr:hypothetical protein YS40_007 [Thermus phage phiYS40]ABJ91401.1 hypothetical protein YS40_007 [Thermus phage phiYS40]BAK53525.1 hypothetical protein YSP_007 [Thermus phage phiYS40]